MRGLCEIIIQNSSELSAKADRGERISQAEIDEHGQGSGGITQADLDKAE